MDRTRSTEIRSRLQIQTLRFVCKFLTLQHNIHHNALPENNLEHSASSVVHRGLFQSHACTSLPKLLHLGMDPPKEMAVSDVSEDAVTISWIRPLAPFEYYKLSYQSARGSVYFTYCIISIILAYTLAHCIALFQSNEHGICCCRSL